MRWTAFYDRTSSRLLANLARSMLAKKTISATSKTVGQRSEHVRTKPKSNLNKPRRTRIPPDASRLFSVLIIGGSYFRHRLRFVYLRLLPGMNADTNTDEASREDLGAPWGYHVYCN